MSLYIIEDDEGLVLGDCMEFETNMANAILYDEPSEPECYVKEYGGHVVKLVEAPVKVVVSKEEAKMLEHAKDDYCAASVISAYSTEHIGAMGQDRLLRAYVNGWTVEKPKRYVLPMEGTKLADGTIAYATVDHTGVWTIKGYSEKKSAVAFHATVTQSDIDAAPAWVKAITPAEVTDDEQ